MKQTVLILGGSGEALRLARALADHRLYAPLLSLAGVTRAPAPAGVPTRRGGFGGAAGLARFLSENQIDLVLDATHPFADQIKRNAVEATNTAGVPLLGIRRPEWQRQAGDDWIEVASLSEAAEALGPAPKRAFLTTGRSEVSPFAAHPQHAYVLRSVEPPDAEALPPKVTLISARGPFKLDDELALMREHEIEIVVSKNSGGDAAAPKLEAARTLGLPVVMVSRPALPECEIVETPEQALVWLDAHHELASSA